MDFNDSWTDFESKMDLELSNLKEEDIDLNINEIADDMCKCVAFIFMHHDDLLYALIFTVKINEDKLFSMVGDDFLSQFGMDEVAKEASAEVNLYSPNNVLDSNMIPTGATALNNAVDTSKSVKANFNNAHQIKKSELPKIKPRESTNVNNVQQQPTIIFPNNGTLINVQEVNKTNTCMNKGTTIPTLVQPLVSLHSVPMYVANSEGKVNLASLLLFKIYVHK